jgi:hypothetical protein
MSMAFRGECPTCGGDYAITKKGLIGKHPASRPEYDDGNGKCKGSGQPFKIINTK